MAADIQVNCKGKRLGIPKGRKAVIGVLFVMEKNSGEIEVKYPVQFPLRGKKKGTGG